MYSETGIPVAITFEESRSHFWKFRRVTPL